MNASNAPASPVPVDASEALTVPSLDRRLADLQAGDRGIAMPWPWWQRFVFRYLLCHCLLYSLPRPFSLLLTAIDQGITFLAKKSNLEWLRAEPFTWPGVAAAAMGKVELWWQGLTTWLAEHGMTPFEVIVQPTDSSDTAHAYVKLGCIIAASLVLASVWSLLSRARGYPRLGRWLHLFARWDLAFWLLTGGFAMLYVGQFGTTELSRLTEAVGDQSPMGMAWTLMAASRPCELAVGTGLVLGGLLLFHRRTALLGCVVSIVLLANVCALSWLYDVPLKLFTSHLLLYAVFLLAPYRERLCAVFVTNTLTGPVDLAVVKRRWLAGLLALLGWGWVVCYLVQGHFAYSKRVVQGEDQRGVRPVLYGIWDVEAMRLDGIEVPITDARHWRFLAIDQDRRAWTRDATGRVVSFVYVEDVAGGRVVVKPQAGGEEQPWTFVHGSKMVKVANPEPRTLADSGRQVDVARRTLVLKGLLGNQQLELQTVERVFPLQRGFHWVQELPYHR